MSQGFFESDDDYRERTSREADERTIEDSTGSAPSKGWFESDDDYRDRISQEADERTVEDSTGSAPSKGWFESDDDYRDRISQEADERTVEDSTGSAPSKGWFESDDDYETRVRREANEHSIEDDSGSSPKQGWFEGDHDYRSRIAHEARELKARQRAESPPDSDSGFSSSYDGDFGYSSSGSSGSSTGSGGAIIALLILAGIVVAVFAAFNSNSSSTSRQQSIDVPAPQTTAPVTHLQQPSFPLLTTARHDPSPFVPRTAPNPVSRRAVSLAPAYTPAPQRYFRLRTLTAKHTPLIPVVLQSSLRPRPHRFHCPYCSAPKSSNDVPRQAPPTRRYALRHDGERLSTSTAMARPRLSGLMDMLTYGRITVLATMSSIQDCA